MAGIDGDCGPCRIGSGRIVDGVGGAAAQHNPLAGRNLYVDPYSSAADAARRDPAGSAEQLAAAQIAAVPQARWFTDSDSAGSVGR